ncbi:terminase large subunit [Ignavigranum ruoffiae]|uniref:terminase large subunit n=1 Tax=Ignavigranum ruoffiae TaxID=89093 RepID=UPI0023538197|nr:terminase TerL endonuclease subunit [Ignavigranum ruoffiae]
MNGLNENVEKTKQQVLNYVYDSLSGKIPQGKLMKQGMRRFLNDLKKSKDDDYPYYMDWFEVYKFQNWARMFKHSKGVLTNQPFELHESLLYESANIFGFKKKSSGLRRFREAYILKARKNSKTTFLALIASYQAFLSDEVEEVAIAGWSKEQSNICYNEMLRQIRRCDMLKGTYTDSYNFLEVYRNQSTVKALSRETKKFGDGFNISLAIIDEWCNSHQTSEIVDILKSGMVARPQPLTIYISTTGFNLDFPAYEHYLYCCDVLDPEKDIDNDELFIAIYQLDEGDDIKDESVWIKSNPIVATYESGLDSLRSELKLALDQPSRMRNFLTKNMNMWVDQKDDGFITLSKWNQQVYESDIGEFLEGASMYYGIDLSATTDLTSIGWVAVKDGEFLVGQHSFMPEDKFKERMSRDKVRFDLYVDRGELTLTPGAVVDYNYLEEYLISLCEQYGVKEVGFDKWNATHIATELANMGLTMVEIPQRITSLTEPTKKFREKLYQKKLFHTGDSLLKWAIGNAVIVQDSNENIKIDKSKSRDRIDPVDAIINGFSRAMYDDQIVDINGIIQSGEWSF